MMENNCGNCRLRDEYGFCEKLVVDTRRCLVENNKSIKANYIAERQEDDERSSFQVPSSFKCIYYNEKTHL